MKISVNGLLGCFILVTVNLSTYVASSPLDAVVINEIHYDPDVRTELVEFVELFNRGTEAIDLSDWQLLDAVTYTFPQGSILSPGAYLIVVQDIDAVLQKWSTLNDSLVHGPLTRRLNSRGETVVLTNAEGQIMDFVDYQVGFPWPTTGDPLGAPGSGASIQLMNPDFDNALGGHWRSAAPTPAAANLEVWTVNSPPVIWQVRHTPEQPGAEQTVVISANMTDSDGLDTVLLLYQIVEPGQYINFNDAAYAAQWTPVQMNDDGLNGDAQAGDDIYSARLGPDIQSHRRLIRYRFFVQDSAGHAVTVPYPDDPQPNFAYFVYDGVPAWTGAVRPGSDPDVLYDRTVMNSLPVYHLISKQSDVEDSTWHRRYGGSDYLWRGTLVYDGTVYDHIRYRARGGVWRYAMGKNMWKFDFNRGHYFQARDDYGEAYNVTWDKLNFSACIQQGDFLHRGEQGLFEAVSFKLFNLMGVDAPKTNWLQFRIIDEQAEFGDTQYNGDFWGLYMTIEQMDGRFLDEHGLPDGNLYKMENHNGELNHQGRIAVTDRSDLDTFKQGYLFNPDPSEQWWRDNVNLASYYAYRCVVEGIHHGDIGYGKNYFFYLNPETNLWHPLPWDVDLTWAENMYGNGQDPFKSQGRIFTHEALEVEYQNRLREFVDLLYNRDQLGQLIDELAAVIDDPSGGPSMADADRAMWDYHPIMTSNRVNSSKAGQGRFYGAAATGDFPGMVQLMKDYIDYVMYNTRNWWGMSGPSISALMFDPSIPETPVIHYAGTTDYAADDLVFTVEPFVDPQGAQTFAALRWRIAEVEPFSHPAAATQEVVTGRPGKYEIQATWESPDITTFIDQIRIPPGAVEPDRTYRVRCRMQDNSGRRSHWSSPHQFVAGNADAEPPESPIRITEIMYHPADSVTSTPYDTEDYEFIEMTNIDSKTVDLSNLSFTQGIRFSFGESAIQSLTAGQVAFLVKHRVAFLSRYGHRLAPLVAGEYQGQLSNGGETLELSDYRQGVLLSFTYDDQWYPTTDGGGHSLVSSGLQLNDTDSLSRPDAWQPSTVIGGSPGE